MFSNRIRSVIAIVFMVFAGFMVGCDSNEQVAGEGEVLERVNELNTEDSVFVVDDDLEYEAEATNEEEDVISLGAGSSGRAH